MHIENHEDRVFTETLSPSPIQLHDPLKAYRKVYWFLIPIGAIGLAVTGGLAGLLIGSVIGWAAAYLFMQFISAIKLIRLNWQDYPLPFSVTTEELYKQLSSMNLHPDFTIENRSSEIRIIFKNTTTHRVKIDQDKLTYNIFSKLNTKNLIKRRHNPAVREYTHAMTAVPIIRQLIDNALAEIASKALHDGS
jgi:hypothetical protein